MFAEDLSKAWRARLADAPIAPEMTFARIGLVLGAGTVLAEATYDGHRRCVAVEDREGRLSALLSAAYGRRVDAQRMAHLRRAAACWNEGDDILAAMHLALTRLGKLDPQREAARRLFMADALMTAGASPNTVLEALDLDRPGPTEKYSQDQPRVPAGNGRTSGQWVAEAINTAKNVVGRALKNLSGRAPLWLAEAAARFPGPATFLGTLLIPTNRTASEGNYDVPGHPGLRVARPLGELGWRVYYKGPDGQLRWTVQDTVQDKEGVLRDPKGEVIGRVLPGGHIALDRAAVSPATLKPDEPRLCPAPTPDKFGQGMGSLARDYEDQVKRVVNPDLPTPRGMGVALPNPASGGDLVVFDDCQHSTGMMVEAKGPTFAPFLDRAKRARFDYNVDKKLLNQGLRQVQAAGPRRVRWYFADKALADRTRELFERDDRGRDRIEIEVLPYTRGPR